ncbi:hypothetical protein EYD00_13925 [Agrobacterium sp. 33MFTa1.1]|uniref:hypothetical protein n=1 Tax=Agrobacterium sp. 33MFTa1.1 TaxID=1279031 RepID=UPI0005584945|nr:hypothetical protein [Agrobacterium sp. 33MFTa1.1]QBJ14615.1 hypothetical protein EYD00_13925 [Agrobacterium sp. 33MFTa1.1]
MRPLVLTEKALSVLGSLDLSVESLLLDDTTAETAVPNVHFGEHGVYISAQSCAPDCRLLVIRRWDGGLFDGVEPTERRAVFDRCARIALRSFDKSIALNPKWMPFRQDNRVSVFAYGVGATERILAEVNYDESGDTYVFGLSAGGEVRDLSSLTPDSDVYINARLEFSSILRTPSKQQQDYDESIDLELMDRGLLAKGISFEDWMLHLAPRQREFVERELTGPLRLRGAAGTGKTLAMVMKAVKIKNEANKAGEAKRILFLTHSWSMAEQIDGLISQLDHAEAGAATLEVFPLLEVARKRNYSEIGREPLGVDSEEGKRKSLAEIGEVLAAFMASDWIAFRGDCSEEFVNAIEAPAGSRRLFYFEWDLLVEFGCVLAAQGILGRQSELEKYIRIRRMQYMMPLANNVEKEVVFRLWGSFLAQLKLKGMISSDQIVCDVLADLQTFYWEAARSDQGYDIVFVDETHLFNAQERLTFHHLLSDGDKAPLVVMALDPKQSPREMFVTSVQQGPGSRPDVYDSARLPKSDRIDLIDVYRYTPEIDGLIKRVLNAVPGLELGEDWNVPMATSGLASGPMPTVRVLPNKLAAYREAIACSKRFSPDARRRGGRVAILCLDQERFSEYARAAEAQETKDIFTLKSRDDVARLKFMQKKTVLSTPEYVAGLQFDTVIILDANKNLVPDGGYSGHQQRRFLSELYLGMSRAEHQLVFISSQDGDGLPEVLDRATKDGLLVGDAR